MGRHGFLAVVNKHLPDSVHPNLQAGSVHLAYVTASRWLQKGIHEQSALSAAAQRSLQQACPVVKHHCPSHVRLQTPPWQALACICSFHLTFC